MDRVPERLHGWWSGLTDHERRSAWTLVLICMGYTAHYLVYCIPQPFYIEDAGISFAYAQNLVDGEGLATYPGGERVEGYSNPTWTFLIAFFYALGFPAFTTSKVLGWVFGVATLPLVWALARRALPARAESPIHRDTLALIAPILVAFNVQFVVWNAAGLENSLFCLLLTLGMWRCVVELEDDKRPYSAFVFFLLCASRPEGIMYALIAGGLRGWHALFSVEARTRSIAERAGVIWKWTLVLLVPLVAYHAWRYWYFAWEFPNTYYAKLGTGRAFKPFLWDKKGWKYINQWAGPHGAAYILPVVVLGLVGFTRRLRWLGLGLVALLALMLAWDGKAGLANPPEWFEPVAAKWIHARVWTLAALVPVLWFATIGRSGWRARGLVWLNAAAGIFFVVVVGGDWMKAHRWFNLFSVPLLCVCTIGLSEVAIAIAGTDRIRWFESVSGALRTVRSRGGLATVVLLLGVGAWGANELRLTAVFASNPETTVRDIHRRVKYMKWVQARLDVDHITLLDVDMGAHMFFTDWEIVDTAGLVDVPMARHSDFNKKFLREYVFGERKPDFAHIHGGWARASRIPKLKEFKDNFIEIPGYPISKKKLHIGNHINKKLFVRQKDERSPVAVFDGGVELIAAKLPAPLVQPGSQLYVQTAWSAAYRKHGFRVLIALTAGDGTRAVSSFAPGYDWYPPEKWKRTESVEGRFRVMVPKKFPLGPVSVSIALLDEKTGEALVTQVEEKQAPNDWIAGAYTLASAAKIGSKEDVGAAANAKRKSALKKATTDRCEAVWPTWKNAVRHRPFRTSWRDKHRAGIESAAAQCFVDRGAAASTQKARVAALLKARFWDHRLSSVVEASRPLAAELETKGDAFWEQDKLNAAYHAYKNSVGLDPRRSWARRKAEDVRDIRLKIVRPGRKKGG
jgi:hypothetical protein